MKYILLVLTLVTILSCQNETPTTYNHQIPDYETPQDTLQVGFLIMDGTYNTELTAPMDMFQHTIYHMNRLASQPGGMKVFTIAKTKEPITTFEGLKILPDYSFEDNYPQIDVLVVPSAEHHLDTDLEDTTMINWVRRTGEQAQFITSHCDGAFVLAKSGLLNGLASTTFPSDVQKYRETFPELDIHDKVLFVHDGKAITSAGGAKSFEASLYLVELLYGKEVADGVAAGLVIDWDVNEVPALIKK
jgi:transcriptional regulator GlxA family with amidase domain